MEDVADPVALERGVLDVDARVSHAAKTTLDDAALPSSSAPPSGAPADAAQPRPGSASADALRNVAAVRAWKAFAVWRVRSAEEAGAEGVMHDGFGAADGMGRGGRERVATLFYLRACCVDGS